MRRSALIASIAVVLALAAGIAALSLWPEPQPTDPGNGDNGENGQPIETEVTELFRESQDNVAGITFSPRGGTPYIIRRDPETGDCELDAPEALFPGRHAAMRLAHTYATGLANLTRVAENADDAQLALFGLDKPVMTWRVTRTDGTSVELMAGAEQAAGRGRYARRGNSREVFLLTELQASYLTNTIEYFYDLSFLPYPPSTEEEPTWQLIESVLLEKDGEAVIGLRKRSEEEMAEATLDMSTYQLTQPFEGESNEHMVSTVVLEPITGIAPSRIETLLPADLSVYGLDSPIRLTVGGAEWNGTLLIGGRDPESGGRYVMIEGYDAVLLDPSGDYRFLDANWDYLRSGMVWLHDIKTVSSLTFELEGVTRVLRFEHDYDEEDTHILRGWLDDNEVSETNARRLYMAALRVTQDGGTDAGIPQSPPEYRIAMHFLDGETETVELYRISDLQFLIVYNGADTGLFINRMSLQQGFLSRFDMLDRGEDIPRM